MLIYMHTAVPQCDTVMKYTTFNQLYRANISITHLQTTIFIKPQELQDAYHHYHNYA